MNYIKELNAFYDWLETNSLSTSAIALWHALMHINNKSGWAEEFGVATSVLCIKTGLSDRTIRNARNELKQKGRIDWKSRKGNQSAMYKIISFYEDIPAKMPEIVTDKHAGNNTDNNLPEINADNVSGNTSGNTSGNVSALYKLNKTKLNETNSSSNTAAEDEKFDEEFRELARLYQSCGFRVNGRTAEWLLDLKERYGFEWVKNAILQADKQDVRNKAYVEKILNNWDTWGGMKLSGEQLKEEVIKDGTTPGDSTKSFKFDKSQFLWNGGN